MIPETMVRHRVSDISTDQWQGDASRWPFELQSGTTVDSIDGLEDSTGLLWVYVGCTGPSTAPSISSYLQYVCCADGEEMDADTGNDTTPGRLWIAYGDLGQQAYDWSLGQSHLDLTIRNTTTNETNTLRVHLPVTSGDPGENVLLWVATDGSTYWGHTSRDSLTTATAFNQCSGYALAVDTLGLADGAATTSPLIDEGSRDFWNDGCTSTANTSGTLTEPDNPSSGGTAATVGGSDPEDILDIGYHYMGSLRHPSATMAVSQSGYWTPARTGNQNTQTQNLTLEAYSPQRVALISRALSSSDDRLGEASVLMGAQAYDPDPGVGSDLVLPLMHWDFNGDSLEPVTLRATSSGGQPGIQNRGRGAGSGAEFTYQIEAGGNASTWGVISGSCVVAASGRDLTNKTDHLGTQYLATEVTWVDSYGTQNYFDEFYVWRSSDGGESWDLIGARLHPWETNSEDWSDNNSHIHRVSLACNNDDLWVFWIEEGGTDISDGLYVAHIDDAASRTAGYFDTSTAGLTSSTTSSGVLNFSHDGPSGQAVTAPILSSSQVDVGESTTSLDAVFDYAWGDDPDTQYEDDPNDGIPVIIYLNDSDHASAARVELYSSGVPTGYFTDNPRDLTLDEEDEDVVGGGTSTSLATTVNHLAPNYPDDEDTRSLHSSFIQNGGSADDAYGNDATTCGSTDIWLDADSVGVPVEESSGTQDDRKIVDVTNRFDGLSRRILTAGSGHVTTNTECLDSGTATSSDVNAIVTNAENLTDIWVLQQIQSNDLRITRVDP